MPLVDWVDRARAAAQPAADGAAGQGRLLGQRDQARPGAAAIADYPVFTRKAATDVSYLACAAQAARRRATRSTRLRHPQRATRSRPCMALARPGREFEFQRLHGMGEALYEVLAEQEGDSRRACRIYAPVGGHEDLLAYLVRRLLENGANSSFVNRMADAEVPVDELIADPVRDRRRARPRRNPRIPLPRRHLWPEPQEHRGRRPRRSAGARAGWPSARAATAATGRRADRRRPASGGADARGALAAGQCARSSARCVDASAEDIERALARAPSPAQSALGRARRHERAPRARARGRPATKRTRAEFIALAMREAGKTLPDAVAEVREAVDFLRYYAAEARRLFAGRSRCRARPARATRCACTAAASSSASARGTSRWRSSPARSPPRWPPATRCSPSRPSRPR